MASGRGLGILVLMGVTSTTGCGISTSATLLRAPPRALAPRSPDTVEVFGSGPPARPHVDLALIEATEESSSSPGDTAELVAKLREKAGELGCDALVLTDTFSRIDSLNSMLTGNTYDRKGMSSTCIVYTDGAAHAQNRPAPPAPAAPVTWQEPPEPAPEQVSSDAQGSLHR